GYRQTNQKTDTGKTLTRWPVFVDHFNNDQVIRLLKQALERAENGGCHSVAVILLDDEGNAIDCWHNGGRPYVMVGAMESLKTDFIHAHIERR
ncbi:hypothetical protein POV98_26125, partial [Klebsiella pneumoniae]|nr:hypothetical protein [Klebsiella pneumoniae]MCP6373549.1 hypothetical protein [Klebsiella pneumoniae]